MYCTSVEFATPAFDALVALRDLVLRQPLRLEFLADDLALEYDSLHLACYDDGHQLLGCLVLKPLSDSTIKMRQVAVHPNVQKGGVGTLLVDYCEIVARDLGYRKMELSARLPAVPFYKRLDYHSVGEQYMEVGIAHQKMEKSLAAKEPNINEV